MSRQYRILDIKMDRFWETLKSDNELLASGDFYRILARVMSFVRNEQIANAIKDTVETYCGNIIPVKGHAASKAAFNEWAKTAGLQSRQSLGELNTELVGVLTWGDCLVVLGKDPYSLPGAISARIKIISPECVQTPPKYLNKGLVEGKKVILGVVLDKHDIELGYYVRMAGTDGSKNEHYEYLPCYDSKTGRFISRLVRRPGSRFPGQVRSFPMLLSSLFSINAIDKLSEFTVKEAQTKSLLAAWLESPANASGAVGLGVNPGVFDMKTGKKLNDDSGEKKEAPKMNISALESGAIPVLESGSKIHSVSNTGNLDIAKGIKEQEKLTAGSVGIPYHVLKRDFEGINFSAGKLEIDALFRKFDLWNYGPLLGLFNEIYKWVVIEYWLLQGVIPLKEYWECDWIGPARPDPDPLKSAKANEINRNNLFAADGDIIGANGNDCEELFGQIAEEEALMKKYGLQKAQKNAAADSGEIEEKEE